MTPARDGNNDGIVTCRVTVVTVISDGDGNSHGKNDGHIDGDNADDSGGGCRSSVHRQSCAGYVGAYSSQ